jgi:archaeoflavoprotein AfpA
LIQIIWGITGAGDLLPEIVDEMQKLSNTGKIEITACFSKAGHFVVQWYKLFEKVQKISKRVLVEQDANTPFIVGPIQIGRYHSIVVAPATGNTVAKIAHGIADTLITNAIAQAQKASVPIYILPTDQKRGEVITRLPKGEEKKLIMRDIDIENTEKLKSMKGITILENPKDITKIYSI